MRTRDYIIGGRKCSHCLQFYPLGMFYKDKKDKSGVGFNCKECTKKKFRDYYKGLPLARLEFKDFRSEIGKARRKRGSYKKTELHDDMVNEYLTALNGLTSKIVYHEKQVKSFREYIKYE